MRKTCVFICGTNCTGKTTLVKEIAARFGGIGERRGDVTYCADGRACLAGPYGPDRKHGGVDALNRTDTLAGIVREGLRTADVIFCEGSYLGTFGINPMNAIFSAQAQLYVYLYCPTEELVRREYMRLDRGKKQKEDKTGIFSRMFKKQQGVLRSARKYASIGVPVISFDTGTMTSAEMADTIIERVMNVRNI